MKSIPVWAVMFNMPEMKSVIETAIEAKDEEVRLKVKTDELALMTGLSTIELEGFAEAAGITLDDVRSFFVTYGCLPNWDAVHYILEWGIGFVCFQTGLLQRFRRPASS